MEPPTPDFDRLLSSVIGLRLDGDVLEALTVIADSPETSRHLVDALLMSQSQSASDDTDRVYRTMRLLEAVAEKAELPACIFMAHLYPISSALLMHDICDSIDIWLRNCKSSALRRHVLALASSQSDDGVRRHLEQLVDCNS
jgi:hypothetical protein